DDLYYRLNVIPLHLPPLRERTDDIPLLIHHFVDYFSKENDMPPVRISDDAMKALAAYAWPGNIRELRNLCENLVVRHRGGTVTALDLDDRFHGTLSSAALPAPPPSRKLSKTENERRLLRQALIEAGGNRTEAARQIGRASC